MKKAISILLLAFASSHLFAQLDSTKIKYKHAFFESPLHLFTGKLKLDYEYFGLHDKYTIGGNVSFGSIIKEQAGIPSITKETFGFEINNKLYAFPIDFNHRSFNHLNVYLNLGLQYQRLKFKYYGNVWQSFTEGETELYRYEENVLIEPYANRVGLVPQFGVVLNDRRLIFDIYFGASMYKDTIKNNIGSEDLPLNPWKGSGLNHIIPTGGIKIGVLL